MLDGEFRPYIDPPAQRKDLPEDPLTALIQQFMFQLRKRDIVILGGVSPTEKEVNLENSHRS